MTTIHPLLDREKQVKARQYEKEKRILGLMSLILSLFILLAFYYSGLSAWLAHRFTQSSILWVFLLYVLVFQFIVTLVGVPLSFYSGYLHEHKWNFSNQTAMSWLWEQLKSFCVGLLIFTVLLGILFWLLAMYPQSWWWMAGLAMAVVSVIFATMFPVVIFPIFNKYTPIEEKELTESLNETLEKGGLKSSGFFMEDMSRQTKKENAFLAGLGRTRRVVLGDNLLKNMSVAEIESIIAHEVGHFKHKHIWKQMSLGTLQQLSVFFLLDFLLGKYFPTFLESTRANLALFPIFAILLSGITGFLFSPLSHRFSRYFERQADRYTLDTIPNPNSFSTALAGLADRNLSNAYPAWWVKLFFYSHPPIGERLLMADEWKER
ncbi:M48 family metallopeptidase [Acidobacteriota bacterium]